MKDYEIVNKVLDNTDSKKIILIGCKNEKLFDFILKYIKSNSGELILIEPQLKVNINKFITEDISNFTLLKQDSLKILENFKEYDAIFLDGNPNWYTLFTELRIIEKNCNKFPLIFVCNSIFPNERRDTYYYFDNIPSNYIHINSKKLIISEDLIDKSKKIVIEDENYHAIYSNSQKNGVLTAIEDYIQKTTLNIGKTLIDSKTGMLLLYFKDQDIFKQFSNSNNNELCNLGIINKYLNNFIMDLLENESDTFYKNHYDYITNQLADYKIMNDNLNNLLNSKERLLNSKDKFLEANEELLKSKQELLNSKDKLITSKDNMLHSKEELLKSNGEMLNCKNKIIESKDKELSSKNILLKYDNISINLLKTSKFRTMKVFLSYLYIIYKFKFSHTLKLNLKLFSLIKNKNWLNEGFYFDNNEDISIFKWFKILTPEAHYICNGYYEGRLPNPYFKIKTNKEEILTEIMEEYYD